METFAQRRGSMDDSFHLAKFPPSHGMGWPVDIAYDGYDALT